MKTKEQKQREGEFFTPLPFAEKALHYAAAVLGSGWQTDGNLRLWDCAAGIGNLEHFLTKDFLTQCYLSTLFENDTKVLRKKYPAAACFQYDYLNDESGTLPKTLREDLANPAIRWLILINPPYATAQDAAKTGKSKAGVADTKIRQAMHAENLGEVSRELFSQFLYRIKKEFKNLTAYLGLFSKIKYINANNDQKLREKIFRCTFLNGFLFSSANFEETSRSNPFPVAFAMWNLNDEQVLEKQNIVFDVLDKSAEKVGEKKIQAVPREQFLSKWIKRPRCVHHFPPFSSALTVQHHNTDTRDKIADGFLASLMCAGNQLHTQGQTAILSGPQASAGALSITAENFEQAMLVHAARRVVKVNWLNSCDQFLKPPQDVEAALTTDCAVWNLFCNTNLTVSLQNVFYKGKNYKIENHFFPFNGSFVAAWLAKRQCSEGAKNVLEIGKAVYDLFFERFGELPLQQFRIETQTPGWFQIRGALQSADAGGGLFEELKERHKKLGEQILTQIHWTH